MSKKELAKKETTSVVEYNSAVMDTMAFDTKDILLSRVLCMQPTSTMVADGKAGVGELRDSVTGALLCERGKTAEIIFYQPFKTWVIFRGGAFDSIVPFTEDNANWAWEDSEGGVVTQRKQMLNYYVAFPKDIEKGDYIPKVIGFQSTAYRTGKKIESQRLFNSKMHKPLAATTFEISTSQKENEKGKWYIPDVTVKRATTNEEINAIAEWAAIMQRANVTVDESIYEDDTHTDTAATASREAQFEKGNMF